MAIRSLSGLSRRQFLGAAASATAGACLFNTAAVSRGQKLPDAVLESRAEAAKAKFTTQKLRGNVSALRGAGGNIAALSGEDGFLLVDSSFATAQPQITRALKALSSDPITHLINTHWHYDHTDGNEWVHRAGATIIAHEKCRERLSTTQTVAAWETTFPPAPAGALPTVVFTGVKTLKLNGITLNLHHYGPSHTDTDLSVFFTETNVLHCGDTWWNGFYPFIDYSTGGNINGMIRAAERNLAVATDDTIIIPGHGPVGTKAQLTDFYAMLVEARDAVARLKKEGRSLNQVIVAKPTANLDKKWGDSSDFIGYVYQGV